MEALKMSFKFGIVIWLVFQSLGLYSQDKAKWTEYIPEEYSKTDTVYDRSKKVEQINYFNTNGERSVEILFYETGALKDVVEISNKGDRMTTGWYKSGELSAVYCQDKNDYFIGNNNIVYRLNGSVEQFTSCSDDTCVTNMYDKNHVLFKVQTVVSKAGFLAEEKRCENGQVISRDTVGVRQINYTKYHCNGRLLIKGSVNEKGALVGSFKLYSDKGVLQSKGEYLDHKGHSLINIGKWNYYNENGVLILVEVYDNSGNLISKKPK